MPTEFDLDHAHDDDISGLSGDARELYHRLEQDGANSRETIAHINQRLQRHIAKLSASETPATPEPAPLATASVPTHAPHAIESARRAPHYMTVRRWATVLATAAIVIAFVATLSVNAGLRGGGPPARGPSARQTQPGIDLSGVPLTPVATPGPAARLLAQVVTARHRQGNCSPIDLSSYFHVGDVVWVFVILKQPAAGHTISVRWFADETEVNPPSPDKTTLILGDNNAGACFALQYPASAKGTVKVYWDRPANDVGDDSTDPSLMATIHFAVLPMRPGTLTP